MTRAAVLFVAMLVSAGQTSMARAQEEGVEEEKHGHVVSGHWALLYGIALGIGF